MKRKLLVILVVVLGITNLLTSVPGCGREKESSSIASSDNEEKVANGSDATINEDSKAPEQKETNSQPDGAQDNSTKNDAETAQNEKQPDEQKENNVTNRDNSSEKENTVQDSSNAATEDNSGSTNATSEEPHEHVFGEWNVSLTGEITRNKPVEEVRYCRNCDTRETRLISFEEYRENFIRDYYEAVNEVRKEANVPLLEYREELQIQLNTLVDEYADCYDEEHEVVADTRPNGEPWISMINDDEIGHLSMQSGYIMIQFWMATDALVKQKSPLVNPDYKKVVIGYTRYKGETFLAVYYNE